MLTTWRLASDFLLRQSTTWAPAGERKGGSFPPETEKIVVEKWSYFPELCKMTEVREEWIENGSKVNFPLRFVYVNLKILSTNFNSYWFLAQKRKYLPLGFLNFIRIINDFH